MWAPWAALAASMRSARAPAEGPNVSTSSNTHNSYQASSAPCFVGSQRLPVTQGWFWVNEPDQAKAQLKGLPEVNLMSMCGLHRGLRGALIGQCATVELTSSPGSDRLVKALRRLDAPAAAGVFYAEHVEADAVHEQLVRRGVIAPMLAAEPELARDVVFGIRASVLLPTGSTPCCSRELGPRPLGAARPQGRERLRCSSAAPSALMIMLGSALSGQEAPGQPAGYFSSRQVFRHSPIPSIRVMTSAPSLR